jgi:hypothetical protein
MFKRKKPERVIPRIVISNSSERDLEVVAEQLAIKLTKIVESKQKEKLRKQVEDKPGEFLGVGCVVWIAILFMVIFYVVVLLS